MPTRAGCSSELFYMMSSSLTPVRHEFLAFRYVFCNSGSQPAEPKSRSAPVALQACQTACADGHYAELTPSGPPLTNSSLVGPGKFVFPISDTSLGAISPDPSNRPVETKPTTSARPVAGQGALYDGIRTLYRHTRATPIKASWGDTPIKPSWGRSLARNSRKAS